MEMQNVMAEKTTGTVFVKQDVDEFYDLKGLAGEVDRLLRDRDRIMINYRSYHFWGGLDTVIVGGNFNDKQTRVWKWKPTFRYKRTFNWVTDTANNEFMAPQGGNSFVSNDVLFHYSYLYANKTRAQVLKYYEQRQLGNHVDVREAWLQRDPNLLEKGHRIEGITVEHPVSKEVLEEFMK